MNKKITPHGQERRRKDDKLIPTSPSSHSCEIWIRSQIRLYFSPGPMGRLWLKSKEPGHPSTAELGWNFQPLPKTRQPVPNHNWNQVEGTSVPPERVWQSREQLQITAAKYCAGWTGGGDGTTRSIRINHLLTNSCNSINTIGVESSDGKKNQWEKYSFS